MSSQIKYDPSIKLKLPLSRNKERISWAICKLKCLLVVKQFVLFKALA